MKMQILAAAIAGMSITTGAQAAISIVATQAAFSAAGTIVQNTNFDTNGNVATLPGSIYAVGALTFVAGDEHYIGGIDDHGMDRSLLTDNSSRGTTVQIVGVNDLFAFNAGNFRSGSTTVIDIVTNLGSYQFTPSTSYYSYHGTLTFLGYKAGAGEYFTSVAFSGLQLTGGTDFQIGTSVPEPGSWALIVIGFGLTGAAMRRRVSVAV